MINKFQFVEQIGMSIVGAAICRPRATNSRPYIFYRELFAKFKLVELLHADISQSVHLPATKKPTQPGQLLSFLWLAK